VKYTEGGDTIELRSRASGSNVVIEIADGGEGVPLEALAQCIYMAMFSTTT
jgi:signal transduction histidine kinase